MDIPCAVGERLGEGGREDVSGGRRERTRAVTPALEGVFVC